MTDTDVVHLATMAALVCLKLAGPPLLASLVVGVAVSLFQAVFQVNDQSLSMVPKLAAISAAIVVTAAWQLRTLTEFWVELMHLIPSCRRDERHRPRRPAVTITDPAALTLFLLVGARAAGWALTVPLFSMRGIPALVKAGLVVTLALALTPTVSPERLPTGPGAVGVFAACAASEVALGAALGWMCSLMFRAAEAAGSLVDTSSALSMAAQLDPVSGQSGAGFARLYSLVFAALVFATDGHHQLLTGFARLLAAAPPGTPFGIHGPLVAAVAHAVTAMMSAAIAIAAPMIGALFLTDAALGLMARFWPQSNMLAMSMSAKPLMALATLGIGLSVLAARVGPLLESGIRLAGHTLV